MEADRQLLAALKGYRLPFLRVLMSVPSRPLQYCPCGAAFSLKTSPSVVVAFRKIQEGSWRHFVTLAAT
jgi:hypothetical protein